MRNQRVCGQDTLIILDQFYQISFLFCLVLLLTHFRWELTSSSCRDAMGFSWVDQWPSLDSMDASQSNSHKDGQVKFQHGKLLFHIRLSQILPGAGSMTRSRFVARILEDQLVISVETSRPHQQPLTQGSESIFMNG